MAEVVDDVEVHEAVLALDPKPKHLGSSPKAAANLNSLPSHNYTELFCLLLSGSTMFRTQQNPMEEAVGMPHRHL